MAERNLVAEVLVEEEQVPITDPVYTRHRLLPFL